MTKKIVPLGVLASHSGPYAALGKTALQGTMLALHALEQDPHSSIRFAVQWHDPQGNDELYYRYAESLLQSGVRHVVGCYTSTSRKTILPLFEKHDGLLWFPAHYEGFESSENVVYTGTAPNHHIYPMIEFMLNHAGNSAYCVGSDYIWAWESNRVFKDEFSRLGGHILGERYHPLGGLDLDAVIDEIFELQPAFILNTLVGHSSHYFFHHFRQRCQERGINQRERYPIASCNLSEADLNEIPAESRDGHFSSSVYFASVESPENHRFVSAHRASFPDASLPPVETEAAYIAVHLLALALASSDYDDVSAVMQAACQQRFLAPQGIVALDPLNHHCYLTPRIGMSRADGGFHIVAQAQAPVQPDPYLTAAPVVGMFADTLFGGS